MTDSVVAPTTESITEANYKKALKRLTRLEKQNAFLVDELVKSRQCLMQMKLEREVILDRVADSLVLEEYDFDGDDDEDVSDISEDEAAVEPSAFLKRKRELIDELAEKAEEEEAFARVLSELSAYQPAAETRKKATGSAAVGGAAGGAVLSGTAASAKKRSKPATSGSRFNRLSALTQAMRTGIISDDEAANAAGLPGHSSNMVASNSGAGGYISEGDDFSGFDEEDAAEAELAQLKKMRRMSSNAANAASSANATPSKDESGSALKVIPVPFDAEGRAILPLSLNMITVHNLGEIVYDRPAYHNKRYILPVGFTTSRSYASVISADANMNYFSTILDNGPVPLYQVTPEGHPDVVFQSASTTGAWAAVAKAAAAVRGKDTAPSVSGPDYFGLANPTVSMLIERLPDADKCESYAPKKYEVSNLVGGKNVKTAAPVASKIEKSEVEIEQEQNHESEHGKEQHQQEEESSASKNDQMEID